MKVKFNWMYVFNAVIILFLLYYMFFYKTTKFTTSLAALCLILSFTYSPIALYFMFEKTKSQNNRFVKKILVPVIVIIGSNIYLLLSGYYKIFYSSIFATLALFILYNIVFGLAKSRKLK